MTRKFTTAEEYQAFYDRVESQFEPEEMEKDALAEWLRNDKLADLFSLTRELALEIEEADSIKKLKEIQKEARRLTIHKSKIMARIDDRVEEITIREREEKIAESFSRVEDFAESKKIALSDEILGREEDWKGKKVLTIRDKKGRFKSWKPARV